MKIILIPNNQTMAARHYCIAKELQSQGHEVTYFMWQHPFNIPFRKLVEHAFTSLIPKTYTHESFTVHKAVRLPFFWPIINGWIFKTQLRRLYDTLGADIIFTEGYTNETEVPKDLPYIYDLADDYNGPAKVYGSSIYKFAFKLLDVEGVMRRQCQHAKAVTAVSSALYSYAKNLNDNTIMMPNGVEPELIERALSEKNKINQHSIVYATGFGPWSRAIETLETITELRKEFPNISLTLVGAGTEVPKIKQYIDEHNAHDYIHYIEYIYDRKELFALLSKHAIGLNISDKNVWRDASHPMKVMDYSALGMKVVSTNLTEVQKLGYDNIFIFKDTNKSQGLKAILRKALKDTRHSYKKVTNKVLDNYSWHTIIRPLISASEQVIRGKVTAAEQVLKDHIVHVTYAYPPAIGGLEQVAAQLATAQAEAGAIVSVITSNKGCNNGQDISDSVPVKRLKSFVIANTTIIPSLFFHLLRLKSGSTVHLHIAQAFTPEVVWLASKIRGFRYVAHVHLDVPPSGWAGFLLRVYKPLVLGKVLRDAHGVAVFTNEQKQVLGDRYHLEPNNVHVIPNGVAKEFFVSKHKNMHKKPRLLFVGRLSYQKNLKQLLDALNGISDQFITTIVGDGELKQELIAYTKELKLKNITFAGFASGDALRNYYNQADIFVLTSEREGMPLVLLEAMAARLPIIATRVTGNKDVVKHRKNGLLVPYNNANALKTALIKLASDKPSYKSMSSNAATMALAFTWSAVRERFEAIYPRQLIPSKIVEPTTKGHTFSLPTIILPLLIISVAAYVIPNIIGSIVTLLFFLTIPGYLLLQRITSRFGHWWERTSLSVVLSLFIIMVGGLMLNMLHYIGLDRPLTTINIFIMLSLSTLLLVWLNRNKKIVINLSRLKYPSKTYLAVTILLTSLPVLTIGGAIRLNNGASNILTMITFAMIGLLTIVLIIRKDLRKLYPYALFVFALCVLFSTSLRGWSVTGHDIVHEYQVFSAVASDGLWKTVTEHNDPYSACLSITILPTILANISHITDIYIFKVVFQFIFAIIAVLVYAISLKMTNKRRMSLIAALIFISFPPFLNDMPFLNRQEIAFIFFAAAVLVALYNNLARNKTLLVALLLLGIVLSHYSTSYVTLGLLSLYWVAYKIITSSFGRKQYRSLFGAGMIVGFFFLTFFWNAIVTQTSPGLSQTINKVAQTIEKHDFSQANGVQYSLFSFGSHDPQETLETYVNNPSMEVKYRPEDNIERTSIGEAISKLVPIETVNQTIRSTSAKLLQILLAIGIIILLFRYRKLKNINDAHVLALTAAGFLLLAMMVLLPILSEKYSVTRMFQQILVFGAIPIVIATIELFRLIKLKRPTLYAAILFIFMFLHLSGFTPQLTGGYPPQMALNNAGIYYDAYYHHSGEIDTAVLLENKSDQIKVAVDTYGLMRFPNYPFQKTYGYNPYSVTNPEMYLYNGYSTKYSGAYAGFISGDLLEYTFKNNTNYRNLLYVNQDSSVYSPIKD